MAQLDDLLMEAAAINRRMAKRQAEQDADMRARDDVIRRAKNLGAEWTQLTGTGISRATVQKALGRK